MLVDRYEAEGVSVRVPQAAPRLDPVLKELDRLLDDDQLYQQVRADFAQRHRWTLVHGRHSTPAEVLLRMLICKRLSQWSYQETVKQVYDHAVALVLPGLLGQRPGFLHPLSLGADSAARNTARAQ